MNKIEYNIHISKETLRMNRGYLTKSERTKLKHMMNNPKEYLSENKPKELNIKSIVTNIIQLKIPCMPVKPKEDITQIIKELKDTLDTLKGYALSANQIDYNKQVCYIKLPIQNPKTKKIEIKKIVAINPKIIEKSKKIRFKQEGCLSFPGVRVDTDRCVFCIVQYEDEQRKPHTVIAQNLESFVWQHEIDHLSGKNIFDRKCRKQQ